MSFSSSGQHFGFGRCALHWFGWGGCCSCGWLLGLCCWFCWGVSSTASQQVNVRELRMNQSGYPLLFWLGERLESMDVTIVVWTRSKSLSLFKSVMGFTVTLPYIYVTSACSFPPPFPPASPAYLLQVHCAPFMEALASTLPPTHTSNNIFFCKCMQFIKCHNPPPIENCPQALCN